jgi:hypothetical protein
MFGLKTTQFVLFGKPAMGKYSIRSHSFPSEYDALWTNVYFVTKLILHGYVRNSSTFVSFIKVTELPVSTLM